jgi:hypothetical protein
MRLILLILLTVGLFAADESAQLEVLTIKTRYAEATRAGTVLDKKSLLELRSLVRQHLDDVCASKSLDTVASSALIVTRSDWHWDIYDGWMLGNRLRELQAIDSGNALAESALVELNKLKWYVADPTDLFTKAIADIDSRGVRFQPITGVELEMAGGDQERAVNMLLENVKSKKENDARAYSNRPKNSEDYKQWQSFDASYDKQIAYYTKYAQYLRNKPGFDAARAAMARRLDAIKSAKSGGHVQQPASSGPAWLPR